MTSSIVFIYQQRKCVLILLSVNFSQKVSTQIIISNTFGLLKVNVFLVRQLKVTKLALCILGVGSSKQDIYLYFSESQVSDFGALWVLLF